MDKKFSDNLRSAGLKATRERVAILNLLNKSRKPITVDEILKQITGVDRATIYRNVDSLKKLGLIRQVDLWHGHSHYELAGAEEHHHLVCVNCEKTIDIDCAHKSLSKLILKEFPDFSKIVGHSFEFFGICKSCEKKA